MAPYLHDNMLGQLVRWYLAEGMLSPSSADWLENIELLIEAVGLSPLSDVSVPQKIRDPSLRTDSRAALSEAVVQVYREVRDHRGHRLALLSLCLKVWEQDPCEEAIGHFTDGSFNVIGDGIAAGAADDKGQNQDTHHRDSSPSGNSPALHIQVDIAADLEVRLRSVLCRAARELPCRRARRTESVGDLTGMVTAVGSFVGSQTTSPTRPSASATSSRIGSQSLQERESSMPPLMSFLSSFTSPSPQPSIPKPKVESSDQASTPISESPGQAPPDKHQASCRSLSAVLTLIEAFQTLAFSPPHSLSSTSAHSKAARAPASHQCIHVFRDLLALITPNTCEPLTESEREWHERATPETSATGVGSAACPRARLAILQWLVRLRADRDHRLYARQDLDKQLEPFASLVGRSADSASSSSSGQSTPSASDLSQGPRAGNSTPGGPRSKTHQGTDPLHRGREPATREDSRRSRGLSRSHRAHDSPSPSQTRDAEPSLSTWSVPEVLPFDMPMGTRPSEGMTTYEAGMASADDSTKSLWLPTSAYVCALLDIIKDETDWDILTYTLCQLPLQLSNKHLFCGPMTSRVMVKFSATLVETMHSNRLANRLNRIRYPDVLAVAYHILNVMISYKRLFNRPLLEAIVETLYIGLSRYPATVKPCLHGLTLSAFELQPQITRHLSKIIAQLSQIVTNPVVSIHILELLIILGSIPSLYSNFTEEDYKRVFTVALRYIQHHNRPETSPANRGGSHALSQHLLSIAYYTIYVWFLAVKLPDRPRYVPHIIRNLLIANDHSGRTEVDEPTEVCFDWLARYSYGDIDPKPSRSFLADALTGACPSEGEKTWLLGNSLATVRLLARAGWVEVESRRPSGVTRFYCRVENATLARLRLEDIESVLEAGNETPRLPSASSSMQLFPMSEENPTGPDPQHASNVPGPFETADPTRLFSGLANSTGEPSMDPSFLAIQLSSFPETRRAGNRSKMVPQTEECKRIVRNLDRTPVIDSHTIGIMYAAPGQSTEQDILGNRHGSPAYTKFLQKMGKLVRLKGQREVYTGGLDTQADEDGQFAYAWWSDVAQILYHTTTMMPNRSYDPSLAHKKKHVGNDYVRIIWNDSGAPLPFDVLKTEFQFANIIIEPHSTGTAGAYSNSAHELEFFKVSCQRAAGLPEFGPIGEFKLISFDSLPHYVREISLLADFFAPVWVQTRNDTQKVEYVTNWRARLRAIKRIQALLPQASENESYVSGLMGQETGRDFTRFY